MPFDLTAIDLSIVWAVILAFAVLMYVILDGFDLGVGLLFTVVRDPNERDTMVKSVEPVWDGNETWLILGGGGMLAVFPLAYSLLLTAFYAPLIAMLLALVFRGVAFEFRHKNPRHRPFWDFAFAGGSTVAAFCQGLIVGAFVQGIDHQGRGYTGGWFDWLTPFSLFTGVAVVLGYSLLGASWLVMKTEGRLQDRCFELLPRLGLVVLLAIAVVSLWTPFIDPHIKARWFTWPNMLYLAPLPILVLLVAAAFLRAVHLRRDVQPFLLALALFALTYIGLGISLYPFIVPHSIDIWEASAPEESQRFLIYGAVVLVPIILAYTAGAYWIFRGKVRPEDGYD